MAEAGKKVRHDDFVLKVVKDPNDVPAVVALSGYVGPSSDAHHTRLYQDLHLSSHVDIANDAILHAQDLPDSPFGGSMLWVKASALASQSGSQAGARFLEGPIQGRAPMMITSPVLCIPPTEIDCFSRFCQPTLPIACATHVFPFCHPTAICPASDFVPCRTVPIEACVAYPTNPLACPVRRISVNIPCISGDICPTLGPCQSIACGNSFACGISVACGGFGQGGGFGPVGGGGLVR